jgi:mRNA-degrading endonuclease RelE of RelBE toxin-antitoxin system
MWTVSLRKAALKQLARVQEKERKQVWAALEAMRTNPMTGDVEQLKGQRASFRRKLGQWRIFFDKHDDQKLVDVVATERRTTTTYRKR